MDIEKNKQRGIFNEMIPDLLQKIAPLIFIYTLFDSLNFNDYGRVNLGENVNFGLMFSIVFYIIGKYIEIKRSRE